MFPRRLIVGFSLLILVACTSANCGVPTGFLEGHLKIISPKFVELADSSVPRITAKMYAEYPLIVLTRDGEKEITRVTADGKGNYRVELPPGDYILDIQRRRARGHMRAKAQPFTVVSNQTVRIDMDMNTGIR